MNSDQLTIVHLDPQQAALFIEFQKRYAFVKAIESVGGFDVRSGFIKVHFDAIGQIGAIEVSKNYKP